MSLESQGNVLDERPLPWIVAVGIDRASETAVALKDSGGTVVFCDALSDIRQRDFHFVVCEDSPGIVSEELFVMQFLPSHEPYGEIAKFEARDVNIFLAKGGRASLFDVSQTAEDLGMRHLIDSTVLRNMRPASDYDAIRVQGRTGPVATGDKLTSTSCFTPLVGERAGRALGGFVTNSLGSQWWLLPAVTSDHGSWVKAILELWRNVRPELFSAREQASDDAWMTLEERQAHLAIQSHIGETEKLIEVRELELLQLREAAAEVTESARKSEHRLLYATGEELVEAVTDALIRLGFEVLDSDKEAAATNTAKREDLQVRLESVSGWVCLAEVKGKTRAAATRDLGQLAKAGTFYEGRTGHKPDAEWYIVNANNRQHPSERAIPLGTSRPDVDLHAKEDNAAVIDTRELFILLRDVGSGKLERSVAQESLRSARGIYQAPGRA